MLVSQLLRKVKKLIILPEDWRHRSTDSSKYTLTGALLKLTEDISYYDNNSYLYLRAIRCLENLLPSKNIFKWNDEEGRTHQEVIDLLDLAIQQSEFDENPDLQALINRKIF